MKKLLILGVVLIALASCVETKKSDAEKDGLAEMGRTQIDVGTVGDDTSMHSLELVGLFGDTLYLVYENNAVGGLACGDLISVEYTEDDGELNAQYIVNLTTLCNQWQDSEEAGNYSFKFEDDGSATITGFDTVYDKWCIINGQLNIADEHSDNSEKFDIVLLTEDSLVLKSKKDDVEIRMAKK